MTTDGFLRGQLHRHPRICGIGDEAAAGIYDQLRIHTELGLTGIELRTVGGRGLHELSDADAGLLAAAVAASGLTVPLVDTPIGGWTVTIASDFDTELGILRRCAARAALLGCRRLRIMSYPNDGRSDAAWRAGTLRRMRGLASAATDLGVTLLHENCQGWAGQSPAHMLDMLSQLDGIRVVFDAGNGLAYGYREMEMLRAVLPYVEHVHIKDGVRSGGGQPIFGLPGEGEVDLEGCLLLLDEVGYDGWYSLEPHVAHIPHLGASAEPERLEEGYRACVAAFRSLCFRLRGLAPIPAGSGVADD